MARGIERSGALGGRWKQPAATIAEYAGVLERRSGDQTAAWRALAGQVAQGLRRRDLSADTGRRA